MRKFQYQYLLFALKRSYVYYYIIYMTVPLIKHFPKNFPNQGVRNGSFSENFVNVLNE